MRKTLDNAILQKLYTSGLKFLDPTTLEKLYPQLVAEAKKLVGGEDGLVAIREEEGWRIAYASSPKAANVRIRNTGHTYVALTKQKAFVLEAKDFAKAHPEIVRQGLRSALFIPLTYEDTSIGVLIIRSYEKKKFTYEDLGAFQLFGSMASLSIHKAQLYEKLTKAVETRDLFLAMAAHELRTPLATLKMYVQFVEKASIENRPIDKKLFTNLSSTTSRVIGLVNDLVQANQLRSGNFTYSWEPCSLLEIIDQSIESVRLSNPDAHISYHTTVIPLEDIILGDKNRLIQVVVNILNNAVKFSPVGEKIHVSLLQNSSSFILSISDKGPGIAAKDLTKIFHEFYRGENNYKDGMGLGLYLAKNIVEAHKGTIEIETKLHHGTTIKVSLPQEKL